MEHKPHMQRLKGLDTAVWFPDLGTLAKYLPLFSYHD